MGTKSNILYYNAGFMVVLPELTGRTTFFLLEDAVEVTEVVKTAFEADFWDGPTGIHQFACGIAQANIDDIVA